MKKLILIIVAIFMTVNMSYAIEEIINTYSVDNKFGLIKGETTITEAKYTKLIRLANSSWLALYKNKYGIISNSGEILVPFKFTSAQRYASRFAKLGSRGTYALFDENANLIIPKEYTRIDILYGQMFLVQKKYKYGLITYNGDILLAPIADDIYMPKSNILKIQYEGEWYEIERLAQNSLPLPSDIMGFSENKSDFKVTHIIENPIASAGYGVVSASDYLIKLISSISPAYEETIDELILGHGADTATILIKSSWLLKFPYVYGKNYIRNVLTPNNGPLSGVKNNIKNKMKK